ncbi:MAG: hypothetical protein Q8P20_08330 [bacterium]|nr:hypothetical protein [bacterium]
MEKKKNSRIIRHWLSYPFIWVVLLPLFILDVFIEIYHRICFPLFGIPIIKRRQYIRIDRHKLKYLDWLDKIGCVYCGYANGLLLYASVITAETERYWCGIKHQPGDGFIEPKHHADFAEYNNEDEYKSKYIPR